jgi:hypothetical protein
MKWVWSNPMLYGFYEVSHVNKIFYFHSWIAIFQGILIILKIIPKSLKTQQCYVLSFSGLLCKISVCINWQKSFKLYGNQGKLLCVFLLWCAVESWREKYFLQMSHSYDVWPAWVLVCFFNVNEWAKPILQILHT